jgi:hypothetical protein
MVWTDEVRTRPSRLIKQIDGQIRRLTAFHKLESIGDRPVERRQG